MFDTIEQLEKEVQEFRENIIASTELLKKLDLLIQTIARNGDRMTEASSDLQTKLLEKSNSVEQMINQSVQSVLDDSKKVKQSVTENNNTVKSSVAENVQSLIHSNKSALEKMQAETAKETCAVRKENELLLRQIKEAAEEAVSRNQKLINDLKTDINCSVKKQKDDIEQQNTDLLNGIKSVLSEYEDHLEKTEARITVLENALQQAQSEFVEKTESFHVDEFTLRVDRIEKSMKKISGIAVGGFAVLMLLLILSMVL